MSESNKFKEAKMHIAHKKVQFITELQQFDPMSVICIETLFDGYLVWYRFRRWENE